MLHYDARDLLAITGDYSGLGMTGENVLGVRRGDSIILLLRFVSSPMHGMWSPPRAGQTGRTHDTCHGRPVGDIRGLDYRNVPVIAAYRPVSQNGWGLVVKQDQKEAFAEAGHLHRILLVSAAILLFRPWSLRCLWSEGSPGRSENLKPQPAGSPAGT